MQPPADPRPAPPNPDTRIQPWALPPPLPPAPACPSCPFALPLAPRPRGHPAGSGCELGRNPEGGSGTAELRADGVTGAPPGTPGVGPPMMSSAHETRRGATETWGSALPSRLLQHWVPKTSGLSEVLGGWASPQAQVPSPGEPAVCLVATRCPEPWEGGTGTVAQPALRGRAASGWTRTGSDTGRAAGGSGDGGRSGRTVSVMGTVRGGGQPACATRA